MFKRLDLKVGFQCNNNCIFCAQAHRKHLGDQTTEKLKKDLEDAYNKGIKEVVFTGGEPTIRPDILKLVTFARDVGYEVIQIQTNGRMLSYKKFCEKLIKCGVTEFAPALHGHTAEIHDSQTRSPGSYNQVIKGLKNLRELDQYVLSNSVITKFNYKYLPELVQLLIDLEVDQLQMAFVHPCGNAWKYFNQVVPRKPLVAPYVHKALDIVKNTGIIAMVEAFPFCFMKGYEKYCSEFYIPKAEVKDAEGTVDFDKWKKESGKIKFDKCRNCKFDLICEGPWKEYPEVYGKEEFIPLSGKKVQKKDIKNIFSKKIKISEVKTGNTKSKVLLCIPPSYDLFYPPLGTPTLTGFLKSKGIEVTQLDLNFLYLKYLGDKDMKYILSSKYLRDKINNNVYYSKELLYQEKTNKKGKLFYYFESNPGSSFSFTEKILSSKNLFRYIKDSKENPFYNFFKEEILPIIKERKIDVFGISITAPSQVISSLTFGYIIKKFLPKVHVVIGGQWISLYRKQISRRSDLGLFFDSAIFFEGETPLFLLIKALNGQMNFSEVPNLIYKDGSEFRMTKKVSFEDLDKLPTPDYDGLPIGKYNRSLKTGEIFLTFETSRGCYWNKCIFCVDLPFPKPRYREKNVDIIIENIKELIDKYKLKHLMISNATFSPWQMKEFSKRIIDENIKIKWWTMARLDDSFTKETLKLAHDAGCEMIVFGLESINQRVLNFIKKGTKVETIKRIIKDCYDINLNFYFQYMTNLPSETKDELKETLDFIKENSPIDGGSHCSNKYYLTPGNYVYRNPNKYDIKFERDQNMEFKFIHDFEHIRNFLK